LRFLRPAELAHAQLLEKRRLIRRAQSRRVTALVLTRQQAGSPLVRNVSRLRNTVERATPAAAAICSAFNSCCATSLTTNKRWRCHGSWRSRHAFSSSAAFVAPTSGKYRRVFQSMTSKAG
jgi:hypothetical protein